MTARRVAVGRSGGPPPPGAVPLREVVRERGAKEGHSGLSSVACRLSSVLRRDCAREGGAAEVVVVC